MNKRRFRYLEFDWLLRSAQIKYRDNHKCQICGSKYNIDTHHLVYISGRELYDYPEKYLITLCRKCHLAEHAYYELFEAKGLNYKPLLLVGMTGHDIYNKLKSKEVLHFPKVIRK